MKRIVDFVVGAVLVPFGSYCLYVGVIWLYGSASRLADSNLTPDQSTRVLMFLVGSFLWVAAGYFLLARAWTRLKRALRPPAPDPVAPIAESVASAPTIVPANAQTAPVEEPPARAAAPQPAAPAVLLALSRGDQAALLKASGGAAVLGRSLESCIVVASLHVSRAHARIEWDESGAPCLVNLGQAGTSVRNKGESAYRVFEGRFTLAGEGTIALAADGAEAEERGDVVSFQVNSP